MSSITLKKATLKDAEIIRDIEDTANSNTYSARTTTEELKRFILNDKVFLIRNEQEVVGLVSFEVHKNTAHCNSLVIYPKFRRMGFGNAAMSLMLKKMTKYQRVELVVHPRNNPAIMLYLSLGFIIESWRENYFGDGEPRLVMIKKS